MKTLFTFTLLAMLVTGCATTSWQDAAGKSLSTVAQSVDLAMRGWEAYSVRAGYADDSPVELRVKIAYKQYQLAFNTALQAYNTAVLTKDKTVWEQAALILSQSQSNLVALIAELEAK